LGATYSINDIFSVYGGVRYLPAKNSYRGTIENIQLNVNGQSFPAPAWLIDVSGSVQGMADMAGGAAANVTPLVQAGAGSYTLPQLEAAGTIDAATRAALEQGLMSFGVSNPSQLTVNQIQQTFLGAEAQLSGTATTLAATSTQLGDKEVDTEQTGAGITPMVGIEIAPNENWNIALKYEMKTMLELENSTIVDDMGLFPDGAKSRNDLPAIFAAGVGYRNDRFEAQLSYNMYFNKGVDWGKNTRDIAASHPTVRDREIDSNGMEVGLGFQYYVSDVFAFSLGGLWGDQGVAESYQSDFSYSNPSVTAGAGIEWLITDQLILDAGFSNTFYQDQTVSFTDPDVGPYNETLGKSTMTFAVGLSYAIF
jgi:long-subunit fatty acid transport protein